MARRNNFMSATAVLKQLGENAAVAAKTALAEGAEMVVAEAKSQIQNPLSLSTVKIISSFLKLSKKSL